MKEQTALVHAYRVGTDDTGSPAGDAESPVVKCSNTQIIVTTNVLLCDPDCERQRTSVGGSGMAWWLEQSREERDTSEADSVTVLPVRKMAAVGEAL